jgi:hypothetical protein
MSRNHFYFKRNAQLQVEMRMKEGKKRNLKNKKEKDISSFRNDTTNHSNSFLKNFNYFFQLGSFENEISNLGLFKERIRRYSMYVISVYWNS